MGFPQIGISFGSSKIFKGLPYEFLDKFADGSIHWAWAKYLGEVSETGKYVIEENGQIRIGILGTYDGCWDDSHNEGSRLFIGTPAMPCEITTKLTEATIGDKTQAGLFISKAPKGFGGTLYLGICYKKDSAQEKNGICVVQNMWTNKASTTITQLPMWFRIRLGNTSYESSIIYFDYSLNGVLWTNLWTTPTPRTAWAYWPLNPAAVGLYTSNDYFTKQAVEGKFDFFRMKSIVKD